MILGLLKLLSEQKLSDKNLTHLIDSESFIKILFLLLGTVALINNTYNKTSL